ncbi:MAG: aminotransferase class III-fold pyridoxal phosphate-dependent enzyme [bacterium]
MDIVAIIQARSNSTRLPKKILLPLGGKTVIEQVVERVGRAKLVDKVVIATTTNPLDQPLVDLCNVKGIEVFRGSEDDVLDRYYQVAKQLKAKTVIRITGDCPLVDPEIIDRAIQKHLKEKNDYTATAWIETFPDGLDVDIFTFDALENSWKNAVLPYEREHATQYIAQRAEQFKVGNLENTEVMSDKRWVLDEPDDYEFLKAVYDGIGAREFGMQEILAFLKKHPEVEKLNYHVSRNEGLTKSIEKDTEVKMKGLTMGKGQQLYIKAKKIIPGGTQLLSKRPELHLPGLWPSYYSKAKGVEVWDLDGNKFIDTSYMGVGACSIGYADPDIDKAVKAAIDNGVATTLNSPLEVELAELMLKQHPWAGGVRFATSGGEVMSIAVRIARAYSGKDTVLFCGYHGWHDWYLASNLADDSTLDGHLLPGLQPKGVPRALKGTIFPFRYNNTQEFLDLIKKHRGEIGVVVMEPMRDHYPDKDFIKTIREVTKKEGIVLVVDEVSMGFRLTAGGAHLKLGFEPDIAAFSKAMGNGYPIAAVIGRKEVMDVAQESFISSTNWTGAVGLSAAIAVIKKYQKNKVADHLAHIGKLVQDGWMEMAEKNGLKIHTSGSFAIGHFDFEYDKPLILKTLFTQWMLDEGFLATNAFYCSYAHKEAHVKKYMKAVDKVFSKIVLAIKRGNPERYLKGEISQTGFRRLT